MNYHSLYNRENNISSNEKEVNVMSFWRTVKFGFAFYIGFTIAKGVDTAIGEAFGEELDAIREKLKNM